jgi:hypothetical protein
LKGGKLKLWEKSWQKNQGCWKLGTKLILTFSQKLPFVKKKFREGQSFTCHIPSKPDFLLVPIIRNKVTKHELSTQLSIDLGFSTFFHIALRETLVIKQILL